MTPFDVDTAIIGSGFSGLGMAIRLKQEGIEDFTVLERGDDVGGTWHYNTYPGCACDVPSHLYSFSFAPNAGWSETYSRQPEIRDYLRRCADEYGVREKVRLNCTVKSLEWDDGGWTVSRLSIAAHDSWLVAYGDGVILYSFELDSERGGRLRLGA